MRKIEYRSVFSPCLKHFACRCPGCFGDNGGFGSVPRGDRLEAYDMVMGG